MIVLTKVCTKCGEAKDLDCFGKSKLGALGRNSTCKPCQKAYDAARNSDPLKREYWRIQKAKRLAGDEGYRERQVTATREWRKTEAGQQWQTEYSMQEEVRKKKAATSMRRYYRDPTVLERTKEWGRERYKVDPEFRDAAKTRSRNSVLRRRENEEFEAFMERMELEAAEKDAVGIADP